jgi:hypothetical protein
MPKPAANCDCCLACYPIGCHRSQNGGECDRLPCHCDDVFSELTDEECAEVVERLGIDIPKWAEEIRAKVAAAEKQEKLHLKTQRNQPFGSERRCCERCGIMLWGQSGEPPWTSNPDVWERSPNKCSP